MKQCRILAICTILSLPLLQSCGYSFQGARNPLKAIGVEKIYVSQFRNATFRPGVEQLFSTAMIREITRSGAFRLVNSKEEADAIVTGVVDVMDAATGSTREEVVQKDGNLDKKVNVASDFRAVVRCTVSLEDKYGRVIFSRSAVSSKVFPGYTATGDAGATNSLNNESEQRLAVLFLASEMMASVYQRMTDTF